MDTNVDNANAVNNTNDGKDIYSVNENNENSNDSNNTNAGNTDADSQKLLTKIHLILACIFAVLFMIGFAIKAVLTF